MDASEKWVINSDHLVHTTPYHHPPKIDVLPKTFLQIILAAKFHCAAFKYLYVPQETETTLAFSSVCFFFYDDKYQTMFFALSSDMCTYFLCMCPQVLGR